MALDPRESILPRSRGPRSVSPFPRSARLALLALPLLLTGCTLFPVTKPEINPAPPAPPTPATAQPAADLPAAAAYTLACPDVLEIVVGRRTDCGGNLAVAPDGRIDLGALGRPRVEGETAETLAQRIAGLAEVPPASVSVRVVGHRSRLVYVFGPVSGPPRAVPYRGPESVVEMLRRVGGLKQGAAIGEIHIVRGNVASGRTPQVFHIDVEGIAARGDESTDVRLEPFDEVYVGEIKRYSLMKILPPWLRPFYRALCGLGPDRRPPELRGEGR